MAGFFVNITPETEATISDIATKIHQTWRSIHQFLGEDERWLAAHLLPYFKDELTTSHVDCLRMALGALELKLSNEDRECLRRIAKELKDGSVPLRLSDPEFYRELDPAILNAVTDRPMTFIRLQQLSMQLTNYLVGFGDIRE